jgi:hypothetical protein
MGNDFDFVKNFEKHKEGLTNEEILEGVRETEKNYRKFRVIYLIMTLAGLISIVIGPDSTKPLLVGLLMGVGGLILMMHNVTAMQIRISNLYNNWVSNNRIEAEIRKSEAADL